MKAANAAAAAVTVAALVSVLIACRAVRQTTPAESPSFTSYDIDHSPDARAVAALRADVAAGRDVTRHGVAAKRSLLVEWGADEPPRDSVVFFKAVTGTMYLTGLTALTDAVPDDVVERFFVAASAFYSQDPRTDSQSRRWTYPHHVPDDWNPLAAWLRAAKAVNAVPQARGHALSLWEQLGDDRGSFAYKRYLNWNTANLNALLAIDPGFAELKLIRDMSFPPVELEC